MDFQLRKIAFVKEFLQLEDEEMLTLMEQLLSVNKDSLENQSDIQPMTLEELNKRINQSMEDSKNGKVISSEELLAEIQKWGEESSK